MLFAGFRPEARKRGGGGGGGGCSFGEREEGGEGGGKEDERPFGRRAVSGRGERLKKVAALRWRRARSTRKKKEKGKKEGGDDPDDAVEPFLRGAKKGKGGKVRSVPQERGGKKKEGGGQSSTNLRTDLLFFYPKCVEEG